ncbi:MULTISPECIES: universal stress protein [unclassified Haladaptatus]|uniref:universal stress protein n=1 Tax=unclassified Haladaptatus TaxID=2622732 RepID=UPI0023E75E27|nr:MULTISPECIES: universal stress protein [unclassified Haladaptatus]
MYDNILFPTDGSLGMSKVLTQCLYQARQSGATVHVVYVVDVRSYIILPEETQERIVELLVEEGQRALTEVETRVKDKPDFEDVSFVYEILQGIPHEAILEYAREADIDLIVMGTHGRTGERKRVLGSIAEEVVREASSPVLTVRIRDEDVAKIREEIMGEVAVDEPEESPRYIE